MEEKKLRDPSLAERICAALAHLLSPIFVLLLYVDFFITLSRTNHFCGLEVIVLWVGTALVPLVASVVLGLLWFVLYHARTKGLFIRKYLVQAVILNLKSLTVWCIATFFNVLASYLDLIFSQGCLKDYPLLWHITSFAIMALSIVSIIVFGYYMVQLCYGAYRAFCGREVAVLRLRQGLKRGFARLSAWYWDRFRRS